VSPVDLATYKLSGRLTRHPPTARNASGPAATRTQMTGSGLRCHRIPTLVRMHRMLRILTVLHSSLVMLMSGACSPQAPAPEVVPNSSSCVPVVEHAISNPADSAIEPARPRNVFIPPVPPPASLRGHTVIVHMHVTERGLVTPESVVVDSVSEWAYKHQLELLVERMRFQPARLAGCWVPSTVMIKYDFDNRKAGGSYSQFFVASSSPFASTPNEHSDSRGIREIGRPKGSMTITSPGSPSAGSRTV
jgi:hypothetical protein